MSEWRQPWWTGLFGKSFRWAVRVDGAYIDINEGSGYRRHLAVVARNRIVSKGLLWSYLTIPIGDETVILNGLRPEVLRSLDCGLDTAVKEYDRLDGLARSFRENATQIRAWWEGVRTDQHRMANRWLPREVLEQWQRDRPNAHPGFLNVYQEPGLADFVASQPAAAQEAVRAWLRNDLPESTEARNANFLASERVALAEFFDTAEKSPLTGEQVESVVRFDNRVRVIASAGSGKTSTMVAKAAYALLRNIAPPTGILMLAFNAKAAKELHRRVTAHLSESSVGITAHTFHSFGLRVIGESTGRKPRVASDIAKDNGPLRMQRIVDDLRDSDKSFRCSWDLFRLVFSEDMPDLGDETMPDDWDHSAKRAGFRTLNGEVVKSQEERLITNWLFYNGVHYEYERPHDVDTADADHSQYHPDFYYPDIGAYHEHWAIGPDGRPPKSFRGYAEGMRWKRQLHQAQGTTLLETTSASVRDGTAFEYLARELSKRGIVLEEDPYRDIPGEEPLDDRDLFHLIRTFLVHAKSNRLN